MNRLSRLSKPMFFLAHQLGPAALHLRSLVTNFTTFNLVQRKSHSRETARSSRLGIEMTDREYILAIAVHGMLYAARKLTQPYWLAQCQLNRSLSVVPSLGTGGSIHGRAH